MDNFEQTKQSALCSACENEIPPDVIHASSQILGFYLNMCPECWMHTGDRIFFSPLKKLEYLMQLNEVGLDRIKACVSDKDSLSAFIAGNTPTLNQENAEEIADLLQVGPDLFMFDKSSLTGA